MAEPTSVLTFGDLLLEAAIESGTAYYGAAGNEAAQVPTDAHDLAEVKRHVNNAVRQFINDAPTNGWQWMHDLASTTFWATVALGGSITGGAYDAGNDETTLTAAADTFFPSMVLHDIVITGVDTFAIKSYTSATVIVVTGDASAASADTFSLTADGNYTLPEDFGGEYYGKPTYAAATNRGFGIQWGDEGTIREARENSVVNDNPRMIAPRPHPDTARRWEVMAWPVPSTDVVIQFPYNTQFVLLDAVTDSLPNPRTLDEAVRAAVKMVIERDVHRQQGFLTTQYLQDALPRAWALDGRMGPRSIGYFGNPTAARVTQYNFRDYRSRPTVDTSDLN